MTMQNSAGPSISLPLNRARKLHSSSHPLSSKQPQAGKAVDYFGVEDAGVKNVVVLGGSYGGMHAATVLAQKLPPSHRLILVERNSHFNHLYVFPRFSVVPGHEHKAFIPYTSIFQEAPKRKARQQGSSRSGKKPTPFTQPKESKSGTTAKSSILEMGGADQSSSDAKGSANGLTPHAESSNFASRLKLRPGSSTSSSPSRTPGDTSDEDNSPVHSKRSGTQSQDSGSVSTNATSWVSGNEAETLASAPDAGNKKMEEALINDGSLKARQEEEQGRPAMQVAELGEAMEQGIQLTGESNEGEVPTQEEEEEEAAQGFEDAAPHVVLQATVTRITDTHIIVTPSTKPGSSSPQEQSSSKLWSIDSLSIPYTHLVYALGSHLPDPLRTVARSKPEGMAWMANAQREIKDAQRIVLVGGGALGVEFATDIKSKYPHKDVTLIHSRQRLLPNFDERIHEIAKARLEELGVKMVLGERLALTEGCPQGSTLALDPDEGDTEDTSSQVKPIRKASDALHSGLKRVRTTGGKEFVCDLLMLCTGQQPNSSLMASLSPTSVNPHSRLVRVHPTLQVAIPPPEDAVPGPFDARPPCGDCDCFLDKKAAGSNLDERQHDHLDEHGRDTSDSVPSIPNRIPNIYAIGDVADAFGALNAGYQAWGMADVAAENIIRDIGASSDPQRQNSDNAGIKSEPAEMLHFSPAANMLKLSLGLGKMVMQGGPITETLESGDKVTRPEVATKDDPEDLGVQGVWQFMAGAPTDDLYL